MYGICDRLGHVDGVPMNKIPCDVMSERVMRLYM